MPDSSAPPVAPPLTKIVATLGPASDDEATITRLIEAGVGVFRLNFSHGDLDGHARRIERVRAAARSASRPIAILGDLQGPRIRTGPAPDDGVEVVPGVEVHIRAMTGAVDTDRAQAALPGEPLRISATYADLVHDVEPGHRVLVADGSIRMLAVGRVEGADGTAVLACTVTQGGILTASKGINCPDSDLRLETLTDRDREQARWAVHHEVDVLALSFVRCAGDLDGLRDIVRSEASRGGSPYAEGLPLIAKIEVPRAVREIDEILDAADGIMIARGDLGVEMDFARVPVVQKGLVRAAHDHGRPCIVATQMLESMIKAASPTRAEATDVASAIFDGADAVMLSGETAIGSYPLLAVEAMARIAREAEAFVATSALDRAAPARPAERRSHGAALAHGVATVADDLGAQCVVVWSQSGQTARYLSRTVRDVPILAVSSDRRLARRMQLLRGVRPWRLDVPSSFDEFTMIVDRYVREIGFAETGDRIIIVAGEPLGTAGVTNSLAMHVVQ